jgi:hypothetical protein
VGGRLPPEVADGLRIAAAEQFLPEVLVDEQALEVEDSGRIALGLHEQQQGVAEIEFEHRPERLLHVRPQRVLHKPDEAVDGGAALDGRIAAEAGQHIHGEGMLRVTQVRQHQVSLALGRHQLARRLPQVAVRVEHNMPSPARMSAAIWFTSRVDLPVPVAPMTN